MAEAPPSSPTHHRPLPAAAAPAPSSTVSLRPHQVPPPPPAVIPAGFVPRVVLLPQEPPRPLLRSEVVGDLSSLSVEEELEEMPVSPLDTAAMEAPELAACSSRPPSPQVLPPVELKLQEPGMAKSPALDMEENELPWQEVRNKRHPGLNLAPPLLLVAARIAPWSLGGGCVAGASAAWRRTIAWRAATVTFDASRATAPATGNVTARSA